MLRVVKPSGAMAFIPFFVPLFRKTGSEVAGAIAQLVADIPTYKALRGCEGLVVHTVFSDKGKEFINRHLEAWANKNQVALRSSPVHQPASNGIAENGVKLAKSATRRLLPSPTKSCPHLLRCSVPELSEASKHAFHWRIFS